MYQKNRWIFSGITSYKWTLKATETFNRKEWIRERSLSQKNEDEINFTLYRFIRSICKLISYWITFFHAKTKFFKQEKSRNENQRWKWKIIDEKNGGTHRFLLRSIYLSRFLYILIRMLKKSFFLFQKSLN